jgi:hypothetical protein
MVKRFGKRPQVFVSYKREFSSSVAQLICEMLARHNIDAFVDTRQLDIAGPFPDRLKRAIEECDVFLCLLGTDPKSNRTTLDSDWVQKEIEHACSLNKPMIPIFQETYHPITSQLSPAAEILLRHDGIRLLDIQNIYVDTAIADIARMTKNVARSKRRPIQYIGLMTLAVGLAALLIFAAIKLIPLGNIPGASGGVSETPTSLPVVIVSRRQCNPRQLAP